MFLMKNVKDLLRNTMDNLCCILMGDIMDIMMVFCVFHGCYLFEVWTGW